MTAVGQHAKEYEVPSRSRSPAQVLRTWPVAIGITLCILIPVLAAPILPTIDLYNHAARYYVLSRLTSDSTLSLYYAANWRLLPNIGMDIIGTWLLSTVPVLAATKVIAVGVGLLQFTGIVMLRRALGARSLAPVMLLAANLTFSFIFTWGFINFLFGLALSLHLMAAWVRYRGRLGVAAALANVGGVIVFLAHGFAFALYGLTIAAVEFGLLQAEKASLGIVVRRLCVLLATATPSVWLFLASKTAQRSSTGATVDNLFHAHQTGGLFVRLTEEIAYRARTFVSVADSGSIALDILLLAAIAVVVTVALRRGVLTFDRRLVPAIAVAAGLMIVTPPALFGVGFVSDRVPLLLALLTACAIDVGHGDVAQIKVVFGALSAILITRTVGLLLMWSAYATDLTAFQMTMRQVPAGRPVVAMFGSGSTSRQRRFGHRCEMWAPLAGPLYGLIPTLFAEGDAQPLVGLRPLPRRSDVLNDWRSPDVERSFARGALRRTAFSAVMVACGYGSEPPFTQREGLVISSQGNLATAYARAVR